MLRLALLVAILSSPLGAQDSACAASDGKRVRMSRLALAAGEYELTMVATDRPRDSARVVGVLQLNRSRKRDGRSANPRGARTDTLEHPLVGNVRIDLVAIGASMAPPGDREHPAPTSTDPTRPGALVEFGAPVGDSVGAFSVLVGTLSNRRDGRMWTDGAGIMLDVMRLDSTGFAGTWGPYGLLRGRSGYFCARRAARAP